ncbi:MAG TPA: glycosyl hydrolase family 28 protein [Acidobacteriaceae bacterium]|jgi:alpha-L-rhamnosidase|nr:glycosyl hydrolase family 28 protein [Acidobacteriaceae bacterium]
MPHCNEERVDLKDIEHPQGRRAFVRLMSASAAGALLSPGFRMFAQATGRQISATEAGAVADATTLNTQKLQAAIDRLASHHGGTLVIPAGTFLTGALFLKPGVHLWLDKDAVLKGSTEVADYPRRQTRVEGHFQVWLPAMINADGCDGLRIGGQGTLDGSGAPFWQAFWTAIRANHSTTNLDVPRPKLAFLSNSRNVQISNITFKDSGFWNLHLYRCQQVLVDNVRFEVPDGVRCPSTDGTDIDSCRHVTIRGCTYSVDDDCVCLKGSKGPFAMDDHDSPPVEHIRVENCTFLRGGGVATLGSEATIVRDLVVENCTVHGTVPVVRLKLRPDTPQLYEDLHYNNITLAGSPDNPRGPIIEVRPWKQYFDLKGQPPPKSTVRNVTIDGVKGTFGTFGVVQGNPGQTTLSGFHLENIDVQLSNPRLTVDNGIDVSVKNVTVNGKPFVVERA